MATKHEESENPDSCWNKAADEEPLFILRAQDRLAEEAVRWWALYCEQMGVDEAKVAEARSAADAMSAWPNRKMPD